MNHITDERALLQGARNMGFIFDTRTPNSVEIMALGNRERYEILNVIEFTSSRKRMSVIAKTPEGKIVLYCKVSKQRKINLLFQSFMNTFIVSLTPQKWEV